MHPDAGKGEEPETSQRFSGKELLEPKLCVTYQGYILSRSIFLSGDLTDQRPANRRPVGSVG